MWFSHSEPTATTITASTAAATTTPTPTRAICRLKNKRHYLSSPHHNIILIIYNAKHYPLYKQQSMIKTLDGKRENDPLRSSNPAPESRKRCHNIGEPHSCYVILPSKFVAYVWLDPTTVLIVVQYWCLGYRWYDTWYLLPGTCYLVPVCVIYCISIVHLL